MIHELGLARWPSCGPTVQPAACRARCGGCMPSGVRRVATRSGQRRLRGRHPVRRRPARGRRRGRATGAGRDEAAHRRDPHRRVRRATWRSRSSGRPRSAASWPRGARMAPTAPTPEDSTTRWGSAAQIRRAASMLTGEDLEASARLCGKDDLL